MRSAFGSIRVRGDTCQIRWTDGGVQHSATVRGSRVEAAKELGCGLYVTGEASWGEVIAAENCGMEMVCAGHYATETFGVRALARAVKAKLRIGTVLLQRSAARAG